MRAGAWSFFLPPPIFPWDTGLPLPPETCQAAEYVLCLLWWPAASPVPLQASPTAHLTVPLGLLGWERMGPDRDPRGGAREPQVSASPARKGHLLQPVTPPRGPAGGVLPSTTHFHASGCQCAFVWIWCIRAKEVIINSSKICHFLMCRCGVFCLVGFSVCFFSYQQELDCSLMLRHWEIYLILE